MTIHKRLCPVFCLFIFTFLFGAQNGMSDTIILRSKQLDAPQTLPRDISLFQNDQPVIIDQWTHETATLIPTDTVVPKVFIIELCASEYSGQSKQLVNRLISDFTQSGDRVLLFGRDSIHAIEIGQDKFSVLDVVNNRLFEQTQHYSQMVSSRNKQFVKEVNRITTALSENDIYSIPLFTNILSFLQTVPGLISAFIREEAFLQENRIEKVFTSLHLPPGERWWFRIVDMKTFGALAKIPQLSRRIRDFMSRLDLAARAMSSGLNNLEKSCELSQYLNSLSLESRLLSHNCRPIVLFDNHDDRSFQSIGGQSVSMEFLALNRMFSERCGGFSEIMSRTGELEKRLEAHEDSYWLLYCGDNTVHPEMPLSSDNSLLTATRLHLPRSTLSIHSEPNGKENECIFKIEGFMTEPERNSGLLTVRFALFNELGERVFNTRRTLLTDDQKVRITIPLAGSGKSAHNMIIDTYDHNGVQSCRLLKGPLFRFHSDR